MNLASYSSMLAAELVSPASARMEMLAVPPCSPGGSPGCFFQANQETPGRRESPESGTTPKIFFVQRKELVGVCVKRCLVGW